MSQAVGNTSLAYARVWHHYDASGQILGRLSARLALLLMGKHKPIYDPATDCGDYIVVTNARHVKVTGKKAEQKVYYSHSQFPGGQKKVPYARMMERKPEEIIKKAVSRMLPKNTLRDRRLDRLLVFPDDAHPYEQNILKRYDLSPFAVERQQRTEALEQQS
ncbi:60S ribosomal protein L23 [Cystobasidium minutum MCA 4210]|uniref:mitochondrial 54S ribosomal protein uL13m n=1 Tax=Cystobasidium minutum MCA 4210 TaxID=1397322 RepID=UPI0034CD2D6A|eukprot:jgi/Rhomi1/151399/estExt_Genewise1.C_3_t20188